MINIITVTSCKIITYTPQRIQEQRCENKTKLQNVLRFFSPR